MPRRPPVAPGPPFTRDPGEVPLEVLRDFVRGLAQKHTYRGVAAHWGIEPETLRKFITGRTVQPHPRQRETYGARYLDLHPAGYVNQTPGAGSARPLPQLKHLLPPDRAQAMEVLDRIFALAERPPGEAPHQASAVHAWLRRVLAAEFKADARYPRVRLPSATEAAE